MGNSTKCFAEVQVKSTHCLPHVARKYYVVVEGGQVSHTPFFVTSSLTFRLCLLFTDTKTAVLVREMSKGKALHYTVIGLTGGWTRYVMEREGI